MPQLTKAQPDEYSPLERDDALTCLALGSGNPKQVKQMLKEKGIRVPLETIKGWAYGSERERYGRIREEVQHFRNTRIADQIKSNALLASEVVDESLTQLQTKLKGSDEVPPETLKAKDLSAIGRDASVTLGIHVQRGEDLESKPNLRISHDLSGMLKEAKQLGLEVIEGEAEEITDAQLVEQT